jgi:LuxR family maltose regulon positive regulatory protein
VRRSRLIARLARGDRCPIVSVAAPAGYGKTTLLSQWAERNGQSFAWVSVDEADNDPKVLLSYVAEALDAVEPIGERVFDALTSPGSSVPGSVVPRLASAFSSMISPIVLVLDDVHVLHNPECRAALSVLADHVPDGSRLALAGRAGPPLRIARLRAEGKIVEIGPHDLSLTCEEASSLLREAGVALGEDEMAELHQRTEGWPAGLYLAALYLREGGPFAGAVSFGGDDRLVSEYMKAEFLSRVSPPAAGVPDPDRGAGAHVRAAVRGGARRGRGGCDPGGSGRVELAAGAAGPAGAVVPLPSPVPRHAAGGAGAPGAWPDAGSAAPRGRLVPGQRPA